MFDKPVLTAFMTISVFESFVCPILAPTLGFATTLPRPHQTQLQTDAPNPTIPIDILLSNRDVDSTQEGFLSKGSTPSDAKMEEADDFGCRIVEEPESSTPDQ